MLKGAVIGLGSMGSNHLRVLNENQDIELVGIYDVDNKRVQTLSEHYSIPGFNSLDDLIKENELDFASVCVPTIHHFDVSKKLLNSEINILVEKPITDSVEQSEKLSKIAKSKKLKLLPGHIERYNPAVIAAKKKILNNQIGRIYRIESNRSGPFPNRVNDIGVSADLAVHDLDVINFLTNERVTSLFSSTQQLLHSTREDGLFAIINYTNDITCSLNVNWTSPTKVREIKIYGEKGMLSISYIDQSVSFYENAFHTDPKKPWEQQSIIEGRMQRFMVEKSEPLKKEIEYFINSILKDTNLESEIHSAINVVFIVQKMIESSKKNKFIKL